MTDAALALSTDNQKRHKVARCRWCGGQFVQVFGWQWLCESEACAERQIAHAVKRSVEIPGKSPFLFLPLPLQVDIEDHPARRLMVSGARGISKSYFCRWYGYKRCLSIPGFAVLLLRCTYDQLEKNHLRYMESEARQIGGDKCKWTGGNVRRMKFFHEGEEDAQMIMGYCDDEADIGQWVGQQYDLILPEEGVTFLPKALREICACDRGDAPSREHRAKLGLQGQVRIPTNPGGRAMNYLKDFYIDKSPDPEEFPDYDPSFYAHLKGDIEDNPYLDENYREASLGHLDKDRAAQLARGDWETFEGQAFPELSSRHFA